MRVDTYDDDNPTIVLSTFGVTVYDESEWVKLYIHSLKTRPECRRKGYAERNMRFFFARAKQIYKGKHVLAFLHATPQNTPAVSLYEKVGMKRKDQSIQWSIRLR